MRTIVAFDTATSLSACALVRDGETLGERHTEPRAVLAAIDDLLREAGIGPAAIDGVVVGRGPGSFTSIRIGLAVARGLALSLGVEVAGACTLDGFSGGRPVIDARRGEVFTTGPIVASPQSLDVAGEVLVGDGATRYRAIFESFGAEVPPDGDLRHRVSASLLAQRCGPFGAAQAIEPLYLREPDAKPSA